MQQPTIRSMSIERNRTQEEIRGRHDNELVLRIVVGGSDQTMEALTDLLTGVIPLSANAIVKLGIALGGSSSVPSVDLGPLGHRHAGPEAHCLHVDADGRECYKSVDEHRA